MTGKIILGIDLGTSGVKAMLLDSEEGVKGVELIEYSVDVPSEGAAEQEPEMWWERLKEVLRRLKDKCNEEFSKIEAVGFSGQMHGLVIVDAEGKPLRPAMLWLDQRSGDIASRIVDDISEEIMSKTFHNRVYPGFAFPSLMWVKENEPEIYEKAAYIMMPKDYIRFKISGAIGTDASDASSACIANVEKRDWAFEIIDRVGLKRSLFPEVHEAVDIAGEVTEFCAAETGIPKGAMVVYGCGDQPSQGIGNGQIQEGDVICNIGTAGQLSAYFSKAIYDEKLRLQNFCHGANKSYTIFGATLSAGLSLKWLRENLIYFDSYKLADQMAEEVAPGCDGLTYLPYISGERAPIMDPKATGMFWGLKLMHDKRHVIRAVMEGVTYSLKDSLQIFKELGLLTNRVIASGGGSSSPFWMQMQADIFEMPVTKSHVKEQACLGACIIAGVGTGIFQSFEEACAKHVIFDDKIYYPDPKVTKAYRAAYDRYCKVRDINKPLMDIM